MTASDLIARYGPTLDTFRPSIGDVERRKRAGILYMRDCATSALRVAGWEGSLVLQAVESMAAVHAFASMPASELEELHHGLVRLTMTAHAIDQRGPRSEMAT